jgi:hypothetical protein
LLAVKYGLTFARRKTHEFREWVSWRVGAVVLRIRGYFVRRRREVTPFACSVLSTFAAEAAVLILVFPPLEFFLARRNVIEASQSASGPGPIDIVSVMKWSVTLCLVLLLASIWLKELAHRSGPSASADEED